MRVRLTRKLARCIDGVDLSQHQCGDVFELTHHDAELLIAEQWAVAVPPVPRRMSSGLFPHAQADSHSRHLSPKRLREIRSELERPARGEQQRRRAEDQFREELRDSRATILRKPGTS